MSTYLASYDEREKCLQRGCQPVSVFQCRSLYQAWIDISQMDCLCFTHLSQCSWNSCLSEMGKETEQVPQRSDSSHQ